MRDPVREPRLLAIVRCGDKSLHREWAGPSPMFDVAVSYFGGDAAQEFPEARYVHRAVGGKWDGLYAFFQAFPETIGAYDYYWFPDDDISASAADVEAMVHAGDRFGLDLFQPSLDRSSYFSHLITLNHPSFALRYTNFVEIMVPVLSRRLFEKALPTMAETKSGFGLDFLWPQLAGDFDSGSARRVAVVDEVRVRHTRPVGGSLHAFMKKTGGRSSADELASAVSSRDLRRRSQINGIATPRIQIVAGVTRSGRSISGLRLMGRVALDLLVRGRNRVQVPAPLPVVRHALKAGLAS